MGSAYLDDYIANAEDELRVLIPAAVRGELDLRGIRLLCDTFRQRGVCSFLLTGRADVFFANAMQSAGAYLAYLTARTDNEIATSHAGAFYDAVGSGFWECAEGIARASRRTWNPAKEYEEDFHFVDFLMRRFFLSADRAACERIIEAHEAAAEGADQAHRDVMVAFMEGDSRLFDSALRELLEARRQRIEEMIERESIPEEHWSWLRYFSSEGLGLLELADRAGLETRRDYLDVSERLRQGAEVEFDSEAWRAVPEPERQDT